jgi:hypothetical protein
VRHGTYIFDSGAHEDFACGPIPDGWRYVSAALELTLDATGRQRRVEFRAGGRVLRGGVVGADTRWVRDGVERSGPAAGFAGDSPALLLAATRLVPAEVGARVRLRLVLIAGAALATREVEQGWDRLGPDRYRMVALDTGESGEVRVAGDVVLSAPGVALA